MSPDGLDKVFYAAPKAPEIVEIPEATFLTMAGRGAPDSEAFQRAMGALYSVAYGLKFKLKATGHDFKVGALEGLWWVDGSEPWFTVARADWEWKLMIRLPDWTTRAQFEEARREAVTKKKDPYIGDIDLESFHEGPSAQIMHIGPYSEERPTIDRLHAFIAASGFRPRGHHHEIYLGDPRRSAPEKLKTILRHPVEKA